MSWRSPGPGDGQGPRDTGHQDNFNFFTPSQEDTLDANAPSFTSQFQQESQIWSPTSQQQPQHQVNTADDPGETSYPRGGINSPQHSRLAAYTSSAPSLAIGQHAAHNISQRSVPQSYPTDSQQHPHSYSSPYQTPLYSRQELPSFGRIDEQYLPQRGQPQVSSQNNNNSQQGASIWNSSQPQNPTPTYSVSTLSSFQSSHQSPSPLGWQQQQQQQQPSSWQEQQQGWPGRPSISSPSSMPAQPSTVQHQTIFRLGGSPHTQSTHTSSILPSISSLMGGAGQHQPQHPMFSYSGIFPGDYQDPSPGQSFDTSQSSTTQGVSHPSSRALADDSKAPLPQNLRGDPFRHAKVKTELCRNYLSPKGCIFGDKCNFAHGEHELQLKKLMAEEEDGKLDVEIFRTHPCFTWLATGACPFDQRCLGLHDPRVNGTQPSWLNHNEIMVNSNTAGKLSLQIDKLYHEKICASYSCSPVHAFAPKKRWNADEQSTKASWREFYSFCCSMGDESRMYSEGTSWPISPSQDALELSEMNRLGIVLKMREERKSQCYVYTPSHLFCNLLCMVLQTRYFQLKAVRMHKNKKIYHIGEISEQDYERLCNAGSDLRNIIVAREIAFGGVSDPQFRETSVWFNISSDDIVPCTRQQARKNNIRSRHKLRMKWEVSSGEADMTNCCTVPPFESNQPVDNTAFDLITDILAHRYRVLECFSAATNDSALRVLAGEEEELQRRFESQRRFWMTWSWPKKLGSNDFDEETFIPSVFGAYNFVTYGDRDYKEDPIFFGKDEADQANSTRDRNHLVSGIARLSTGFIWKSFVMNLQLQSEEDVIAVPDENEVMPIHDPLVSRIRRLPILRALSLGKPIVRGPSTRVLPTLISEYCSSTVVNITLDVVIREWTYIYLQHKEKKDKPLKEAQSAKDATPEPTQRRSVSYSFDDAAKSWTRELPHYS